MAASPSSTAKDRTIFIADNYSLPVQDYQIARCYEDDLKEVLVPHGAVCDRIKKMAKSIQQDVGNVGPLVCVCVLKGAHKFYSALTEELIQLRQDCDYPMLFDFIRVSSYANSESTGRVDIQGWDKMTPLRGKNVLIIEDLIDTGLTMKCLLERLREDEPAMIKVATLAIKRTSKRVVHYTPDYVGFSLPDKFVVGFHTVGFGFDYNNYLRDLSHVAVMNEQGVDKYRTPPPQHTNGHT